MDNTYEVSGTAMQVPVEAKYVQRKQDALSDYSINIEFLSIGCVIRVGCKSIPFSTVEDGMKALNDYVANPQEIRKTWEKRFSKEE
jgi:hypothetical protein